MRRRLHVVPFVAVLLGATLLVLACTAAPVRARTLTVTIGDPQDFRSARFWPASVRLGPAPSAVDVVLSLRLVGGRPEGRRVTVEVCSTASCVESQAVRSSTSAGTVAVGRVGSVEPHQVLHLGVRVHGGGPRPDLMLNASPCAAPLPRDLWRVKETGLGVRANTVAGMENCSSRTPPYLPFALEVLVAGAAIVGSTRWGRR